MNLSRIIHRSKERRGANAVEFALTAPVLFFLILATMDFGWYFTHMLLLESATNHGARVASLVIGSNDLSNVATPVTEAQSRWDGFGLPSNSATFTMTLDSSTGVDMVVFTGTVPYDAFGGWDKLLGDVNPLPTEVSTVVTRRLENQLTTVSAN